MLVLTRKKSERVEVIDENTGLTLGTVSVESIRGEAVRLGFEFRKNVRLVRTEISDVEPAFVSTQDVR